jgi:hypothetical protein
MSDASLSLSHLLAHIEQFKRPPGERVSEQVDLRRTRKTQYAGGQSYDQLELGTEDAWKRFNELMTKCVENYAGPIPEISLHERFGTRPAPLRFFLEIDLKDPARVKDCSPADFEKLKQKLHQVACSTVADAFLVPDSQLPKAALRLGDSIWYDASEHGKKLSLHGIWHWLVFSTAAELEAAANFYVARLQSSTDPHQLLLAQCIDGAPYKNRALRLPFTFKYDKHACAFERPLLPYGSNVVELKHLYDRTARKLEHVHGRHGAALHSNGGKFTRRDLGLILAASRIDTSTSPLLAEPVGTKCLSDEWKAALKLVLKPHKQQQEAENIEDKRQVHLNMMDQSTRWEFEVTANQLARLIKSEEFPYLKAVEHMNARCAIMAGGSQETKVVWKQLDDVRKGLTLGSKPASGFVQEFKWLKVTAMDEPPVGKDKKPPVVPFLEWWRRTRYGARVYSRTVFVPWNCMTGTPPGPDKVPPDCINLWQGLLAYELKPYTREEYDRLRQTGELHHALFLLNHLRDEICRGDMKLVEDFIGWLAWMIFHPDSPTNKVFGVQGEEGNYKTMIFDFFCEALLGRHYVKTSQNSQVTGRFNDHLADAIFILMEEAKFDRKNKETQILQDRVTSRITTVEKKFGDVKIGRSYGNYGLTSNDPTPVMMNSTARRWVFLRTANLISLLTDEERVEYNRKFIEATTSDEGIKQFWSVLCYEVDLDAWRKSMLTTMPKTDMNLEGQLHTMAFQRPALHWLHEKIFDEDLPNSTGDGPWSTHHRHIRTLDAYETFKKQHAQFKVSYETFRTDILQIVGPEVYATTNDRGNVEKWFDFPILSECEARLSCAYPALDYAALRKKQKQMFKNCAEVRKRNVHMIAPHNPFESLKKRSRDASQDSQDSPLDVAPGALGTTNVPPRSVDEQIDIVEDTPSDE